MMVFLNKILYILSFMKGRIVHDKTVNAAFIKPYSKQLVVVDGTNGIGLVFGLPIVNIKAPLTFRCISIRTI